MMKKMFLGVAFALAALMPVNAQRNAKAQNISPEQAIEMRTNRMAKRLMLDDVTTAKFAPIYKEYLTELQECMKNCPNAANCPANGQKCAAMPMRILKNASSSVLICSRRSWTSERTITRN